MSTSSRLQSNSGRCTYSTSRPDKHVNPYAAKYYARSRRQKDLITETITPYGLNDIGDLSTSSCQVLIIILKRPYGGEKIACVSEPLSCMIHLKVDKVWEDVDGPSGVDTVPIYKELESWDGQMDLHWQVRLAGEDTSKREWRGDVKISKVRKRYC